jgi:hypothetical protein
MTQARDVADGKFTNTTLTIDSGSDNANTLLLSDGAADANIVDGFVTCRHHSSSEEPVLMIQGRSTSSENIVLVGGTHNNSTYNTATSIKFFTASGYTNTTPVERMRVTGDGLTFNGDTAAANALDDYEEGTFDCSIHDGTTTPTQTEFGHYIKIGKMVHIHGQTTISGSSSGGNSLRITLPFQVVSDARGAIAVGLNQPCSLTTNGEYLSFITEINSTNAFIISHAFGGGHTHLNFNQLGTGIFSFGGSYRTA